MREGLLQEITNRSLSARVSLSLLRTVVKNAVEKLVPSIEKPPHPSSLVAV